MLGEPVLHGCELVGNRRREANGALPGASPTRRTPFLTRARMHELVAPGHYVGAAGGMLPLSDRAACAVGRWIFGVFIGTNRANFVLCALDG